jgi:MFS family permease
MYGGFVLYIGGMAWITIISLIAGFSQNWMMLFILRALQGLGLASSLPASIMILGRAYRPGPRKNLVFSIYGACAVMGFFFGIFFSGICGEFLAWSWYFFFGAIFSAVTLVSGWFSIPSDWAEKQKMKVKMDWIGSTLLVPGLVLPMLKVGGRHRISLSPSSLGWCFSSLSHTPRAGLSQTPYFLRIYLQSSI